MLKNKEHVCHYQTDDFATMLTCKSLFSANTTTGSADADDALWKLI
jgi:hypothetical protein